MAKSKTDKAAPARSASLVRMVRDSEQFPAPHEADVHPDEVANFAADGWVEA